MAVPVSIQCPWWLGEKDGVVFVVRSNNGQELKIRVDEMTAGFNSSIVKVKTQHKDQGFVEKRFHLKNFQREKNEVSGLMSNHLGSNQMFVDRWIHVSKQQRDPSQKAGNHQNSGGHEGQGVNTQDDDVNDACDMDAINRKHVKFGENYTLEVPVYLLNGPPPQRAVRELSDEHVQELRESLERCRTVYTNLAVHIPCTYPSQITKADVLQGKFTLEVLGGNHTRQALMDLDSSRHVPTNIFAGLTNDQALVLGYEHNKITEKSRQMTFKENVHLFRRKVTGNTDQGLSQGERTKWRKTMSQILGTSVLDVRRKFRMHTWLASQPSDLWDLIWDFMAAWEKQAVKDQKPGPLKPHHMSFLQDMDTQEAVATLQKVLHQELSYQEARNSNSKSKLQTPNLKRTHDQTTHDHTSLEAWEKELLHKEKKLMKWEETLLRREKALEQKEKENDQQHDDVEMIYVQESDLESDQSGEEVAVIEGAGKEVAVREGAVKEGAGKKGAGKKGAWKKGAEKEGAEEEGAGKEGAGKEGAGKKGTEKKGAGNEGAEKEGTGKEGAGKKGAEKKGAGKEGAGKEGAEKEGAEKEGAGKEGAGKEGAGKEGIVKEGAVREGAGKKGSVKEGAGKDAGKKGAGKKGAEKEGAEKEAGKEGAEKGGAVMEGAVKAGTGKKAAGKKAAVKEGAGKGEKHSCMSKRLLMPIGGDCTSGDWVAVYYSGGRIPPVGRVIDITSETEAKVHFLKGKKLSKTDIHTVENKFIICKVDVELGAKDEFTIPQSSKDMLQKDKMLYLEMCNKACQE